MRLKVACRERRIHVRRPGVPPGAATVVGRYVQGAFGAQTGSEQLRFPRARLFPLPPLHTAESSPYPRVQPLEGRLHLRMSEVVGPAEQQRSQLLHLSIQVAPARPPEFRLQFLPQPVLRFRCHLQPWCPLGGHPVAQKLPLPRAIHRALGAVYPQSQSGIAPVPRRSFRRSPAFRRCVSPAGRRPACSPSRLLPPSFAARRGRRSSLSAVTLDAPLALSRRFRRLPPTSVSGFSPILLRVSFVIEAQVPSPCSVFRPSVGSSRPTMPSADF